MNVKQIKVVLSGLNGYGARFASLILELPKEENCQLVGVVSRNPIHHPLYPEMVARGVKFYACIEECLEKEQVDLAIIATPIHIHKREVMAALRHGANVYCEKPIAPTIDECLEIEGLAREVGKFVAVGFQWSFSEAILKLKKDILANRFGKPKRCRSLTSWVRPESYFTESAWKGKSRAQDGGYILDSVLSNTTIHYLHNMLFLLGPTLETSAYPLILEGEGYKAYEMIEGYDTACLRIHTTEGYELIHLTTITAKEQTPPSFILELEEATAYYQCEEVGDEIIVITNDGNKISYGNPDRDRVQGVLSCIMSTREHTVPVCTVTTTIPEVMVVNGAVDCIPVIDIEKDLIKQSEDQKSIYVEGLQEILGECFKKGQLPAEIEVSWAQKSKALNLSEYCRFEGRLVR